MKKYEVPVMRFHQLKSDRLLQSVSGKEYFDRSAANTEGYEYDNDFNSDNFFNKK